MEKINISEIAREMQVSSTTMKKYINEANGDIELAKERIRQTQKNYIYNGKVYKSINTLSEATGINRRTLTKLLEETNGNAEEAVDIYRKKEKVYEYNGIEYKTKKELAKALTKKLGIEIGTVYKYLKLADDDIELAIKLYYEEHTYFREGEKRYATQQELATELNITVSTLVKYIEQNNGDIKAAVEYIRTEQKNTETYFFGGKEYPSLNQLAHATGLNTTTLRRIIKQFNGDIDSAVKDFKERHSGYILDGKIFTSQRGLAKVLGVSLTTLSTLINKFDGDMEAVKAEVEKIKEKKQELKEKKERKQEASKEVKVYIYKGEEFDSIRALSIHIGMPETTLGRIVNRAKSNDLEEEITEYYKKQIEYYFDGKTFKSIKELAEYTGIRELRLGRYIRKYDRNAEKAIFMIRLADRRKQKITISENYTLSIPDMAILLGMKERELITLLNQGMTYEQIKEMNKNKTSRGNIGKNEKLMYDDKISLLQYCIDNNINYSCIFYSITVYGMSKEEAIENYRKCGQRIPTTWIFEKYGVLLKHLYLSEGMDYKQIILEMRNYIIGLDEATENYIIRRNSKQMKVDYQWVKELYSILALENLPEDEKTKYLEEFYVTRKEKDCISKSKTDIERFKRKKLLFEIAECLQKGIFSLEEQQEIIKEYDITLEELDEIYLDLYSQFKNGVLLAPEETEKIKRNEIRDITKRWINMTEQERREVSEKDWITEEDLQEISRISSLLENAKRMRTKSMEEKQSAQK